jgi:hypothetical protein
MRIAVISAPKSGNHWIKCLLGKVYDLEWVPGRQRPVATPNGFRTWIESGGFPDQSIFHQHCKWSPRLSDVFEAAGVHLVTIVRDPYDVFVSLYRWIQEEPVVARSLRDAGTTRSRPRDAVIGKPLDHQDVLDFLAGDFGSFLDKAGGWKHSGRAVVVRYEGLHGDPVGELTRTTDVIQPVGRERIEWAIEECRAENMRQMRTKFQGYFRSAKVGDSHERLSEAHLLIFRERYADLIRSLGYAVR